MKKGRLERALRQNIVDSPSIGGLLRGFEKKGKPDGLVDR